MSEGKRLQNVVGDVEVTHRIPRYTTASHCLFHNGVWGKIIPYGPYSRQSRFPKRLINACLPFLIKSFQCVPTVISATLALPGASSGNFPSPPVLGSPQSSLQYDPEAHADSQASSSRKYMLLSSLWAPNRRGQDERCLPGHPLSISQVL